MPSSRRTTGRGAADPAAAAAAGHGGAGGAGDPRVPPFTRNNTDHNPRDLRSWARRTGFHPSAFFSGESAASNSSTATAHPPPPPPPPATSRRPPRAPEREPVAEADPDPAPPVDLERGRGARAARPRRRIDLRGELEIPPAAAAVPVPVEVSAEPEAPRGERGDERRRNGGAERLLGETEPLNAGGRKLNGVRADSDARKKAEEAVEAKRKAEEARKKKEDEERDAELAAYYQEQWANEEDGGVADGGVEGEAAPLSRPSDSGLRCDVAGNPGWGGLRSGAPVKAGHSVP